MKAKEITTGVTVDRKETGGLSLVHYKEESTQQGVFKKGLLVAAV